jgi:hypothetical protein
MSTLTVQENNDLDFPAIRQERKGKFLLFHEIETTSRKDWLVKDLLGSGEASAWYGVPGSGKSVVLEDMALHIAAGWVWHGRQVKQGAVLYIALERFKVVERRANAFRQHYNITKTNKMPFALIGGVYDFRDPRTVTTIIDIVHEVEAETGQSVVLIVIETISRALCGGDENSPKDMGQIVAATSRLQNETKAHVLWVHHVPQDGKERLRGHGALLGAMDTTVHVEKCSDSIRKATVIKANDAEEGEYVNFTLKSVTIGPETTAPVVVEADPLIANAVFTKTKKRRKISDRSERALRVLHDAIVDHGQPAPLTYGLPASVRTITIERWQDELRRGSVIDGNHKNPTVAFQRVRDSLAVRRLIGLRDNLVWPVTQGNGT